LVFLSTLNYNAQSTTHQMTTVWWIISMQDARRGWQTNIESIS